MKLCMACALLGLMSIGAYASDSPYLFVWAADADKEHSDFLAVLDANCPSSNKWNRGSDYLVESFVPRSHVTRHAAGSANDVSRWSSS
jgi:hypothetical protein